MLSYYIMRWCTYICMLYTQTDRDTVQCEPQNNMLVTSVSIYVHTDIMCCMLYVVYCKCHALCEISRVSCTHMLCVFIYVLSIVDEILIDKASSMYNIYLWYYVWHLQHLLCAGVLSTILYTIQHNAIVYHIIKQLSIILFCIACCAYWKHSHAWVERNRSS